MTRRSCETASTLVFPSNRSPLEQLQALAICPCVPRAAKLSSSISIHATLRARKKNRLALHSGTPPLSRPDLSPDLSTWHAALDEFYTSCAKLPRSFVSSSRSVSLPLEPPLCQFPVTNFTCELQAENLRRTRQTMLVPLESRRLSPFALKSTES